MAATLTPYVGRRRATSSPGRTVYPIWAAFTALRWLVILTAPALFLSSAAYNVNPPFTNEFGVRRLVGTWDAGIFRHAAVEGYPLGPDEDPLRAAFFPGWPLAEWLGSLPLSWVGDRHDAVTAAGVVLTSACSLAACWLLYRVTSDRFGSLAGAWSVVALMVWPSAGFLTALYSEGLFLVAALGAWLLASRGQWLAAGVVAGLASLTRVNGVFLVAALLLMYLVSVPRERWSGAWQVLVGGWGVAAWFAFLWVRTGDPLAWFHAQGNGWGRHAEWPWTSVANTWEVLTSSRYDNADWRWQAAADLVFVAGWVAFTVVLARRRHWPELTLSALTLASLVTSTNYLSVTRSSLSVFPLMMAAGVLLAGWSGRVRAVALSLSGVWMLAVMGAFALGFWAG